MALVKKLTRIGNSWGIILPADIMKIAGIHPESECELQVEKKGVLLSPRPTPAKSSEEEVDQRVAHAMARFTKKYHQDLEKMA